MAGGPYARLESTHPWRSLRLSDREVTWSLGNVVWGRIFLGEIIGIILLARVPVDEKLTLINSVPDPVEAHVNRFGSALFDLVEGQADCHFIVGLNGSGRLRVAHFG